MPVLAIYALYELLMRTPRFENKVLSPLKSHTTSDLKSRSFADVEILTETGQFWEGIEIKHKIAITPAMVEDAYAQVCDRAAGSLLPADDRRAEFDRE